MTLPDIDTLNTYGGALLNFSSVVDTNTDRGAAGANQMFASISAMTQTAIRAWVSIAWNGSAFAVAAHDAVWGNATGLAPVLTHPSTGLWLLTWNGTPPGLGTVSDEIPSGFPGGGVQHVINFRAAFGRGTGGTTPLFVQVIGGANSTPAVNANQALVMTANRTGLIDPPTTSSFTVWCL